MCVFVENEKRARDYLKRKRNLSPVNYNEVALIKRYKISIGNLPTIRNKRQAKIEKRRNNSCSAAIRTDKIATESKSAQTCVNNTTDVAVQSYHPAKIKMRRFTDSVAVQTESISTEPKSIQTCNLNFTRDIAIQTDAHYFTEIHQVISFYLTTYNRI